MRILIAIHYFPPHVGGMENVAKTQAVHLAQAGDEVTVLTSAVEAPHGRQTADGYTTIRIRVWNYFERAMGVPFPFFAPSILWKAFKLVKQSDVVHAHDAFYISSLVVAFWAFILRKPLVLTQHVDLIPHPKKIVNLVQVLVYKTTGRFVLYVSKKIAILNSNVKNFLVAQHVAPDKMIFMPNGVDITLFHPDKDNKKETLRRKHNLPLTLPIALFVGRFVPKKGFQLLLECGSDIYHIALVGGEAPEGYVQNDQFSFLGSLPPARLAEVYRAVDMFILPSQGEGFPLVAQEAMATRLPIIISKHPGYDLYAFDTSKLKLISPEKAVISQTLQELAQDEALREHMADYSYTYATSQFSWEHNIDTLRSVYREAAGIKQ